MMKLEPYIHLNTSGARSVKLFAINQQLFLAIPQLAKDLPEYPASMNGGNSDTHANIYIWKNHQFELFQKLNVHGGEHIDFGVVDGTPMLAIANIRSGQQPNFNMNTKSQIYAWENNEFKLVQTIPTFAAKSTCLFKVGEKAFLGIAEGVAEPQKAKVKDNNSHLFSWNGEQFVSFQSFPGIWGYDMSSFCIGKQQCLAIADHVSASTIYVWQDNAFQMLQAFDLSGGGRHFCYFEIEGEYYLAVANLVHDSHIYRWDGKQFKVIQTIEGAGTRHFHFKKIHDENYLFRTKFITGTREAPICKQTSQVYRWDRKQFQPLTSYTTFGGTASETFEQDGEYYLVVSNSLTETSRFRVDSIIYKIGIH